MNPYCLILFFILFVCCDDINGDTIPVLEKLIFSTGTSSENPKIREVFVSGLSMLPLVLSIALFAKVIQRQWRRFRSEKTRKQGLESELEMKHKLEQDLRNELEFKSKELTSFTLSIIQKKETLEAIKGDIEHIKQRSEAEVKGKLTEIVRTINFSHHFEKDWDNFKLYFDQVHPGFFSNLQAKYPELNSNDLKLCALFRMNLHAKQIASIMDISPDSVKVSRHRIRKKMGLVGSESLDVFFTSTQDTQDLIDA